ncbi:AAA family ATPase [Shewanella algidipiscicola]|uniref:AAA family ATPase n=1 Tax=Shewanella algidipiscicola TaxID=614070 RepID=UPI000D7865DF|nr:AAA family ATPase [Shewanella algidipiscicola]
MTYQASILLPSQESLLHRLQHVILYGQQLTVLTGEYGAGKTTIVTALVDALDDVSSALVTCPQHADCAEIRRKILVQLLSEPVFDDELPLPETLLDLAQALPANSHIVLDDAHHLPLEIWAECIVLSQMQLVGKSLSVTLTTPNVFLSQLLTQLPESQHQLLLPMVIEPLSYAEREALYYTLLQRSEQTTFTPRDIVKDQLQQQQGLPSEVVALLSLALDGEPETPVKRGWLKSVLLTLLACAVLVAGYVVMLPDVEPLVLPQQQTVASVRATRANITYGEALLAPYFDSRQLGLQAPHAEDIAERAIARATLRHDNLIAAEQSEENTLSDGVEAEVDYSQLGQFEPISTDRAEMQLHNDKVEIFSLKDDVTAITTAPQQEVEPEPTLNNNGELNRQMPQTGYTLQLASVKKLKSLNEIVEQLNGSDNIQVARYKQRWVVLYGRYSSREQAMAEAQRLQNEVGLAPPWLRVWGDLSQYELQQRLPTREIQ